MNTKDEALSTERALKLALEALESDPLDMVLNPDGHMGFRKDQAIDAIRAALASKSEALALVNKVDQEQPAQKPPKWQGARFDSALHQQPAQQEPVEWGVDWGKAGDQSCVSIIKRTPGGGVEVVAVEYGPQRTWVGLTDEEIKDCFKITPDQHLPWHIYQRIEAKLKEKNT